MLSLPQDFKELLKLLIDRNVRFLIVGGSAVTFHGYPRFTGALDVWVDRTEANSIDIVSALELSASMRPGR